MNSQLEGWSSGAHPFGIGGILDFEKPLARIEREIAELEAAQAHGQRDLSSDIRELRATLANMTKRTYANLSAWETVLVARHPRRPGVRDYIAACVKDFCELHGDRCFADDKAIVTAFGRIGGQKILLVGHDKGSETKEKIERHFGCPHPEGYRKSLLKMRLAEKFKLPVVTVIDTQGAYPGDKAEERGIAQSIAANLMVMSRLRVPIVCVVIGEGGSGGALGIGVGDRLAMFEHAYFSVITPEGCAAILFKTAEQAPRAAKALKLTANDLKKLNLIEDILPEPLGGGHRDPAAMFATFEQYVVETVRELKRVRIDTLLRRRYERLRRMGCFFGDASARKDASGSVPGARPAVRASGSAGRMAASGNGDGRGGPSTAIPDASAKLTSGSGRLAAARAGDRSTEGLRIPAK